MLKKRIPDFDIRQIAGSGQCFRMNELSEGRFSLAALGAYLEIHQEGEEVCFSCEEEEFEGIWRSYFDLDTDYGRIKNSVEAGDRYLTNAVHFGKGIRILRQALWEVIATFIISQQNNIPRIKKCTEALCAAYGEKRTNFRGGEYDTFPGPDVLAAASEEDLRACNLGYRGRYIKNTARMAAQGEIDLMALKGLGYEEARQELLRLCGVGEKVADCICLFALHHVGAFPVDTHIRSVLRENYPGGFPAERFPDCAGILQQYMFYYDLHGRQEKARVKGA